MEEQRIPPRPVPRAPAEEPISWPTIKQLHKADLESLVAAADVRCAVINKEVMSKRAQLERLLAALKEYEARYATYVSLSEAHRTCKDPSAAAFIKAPMNQAILALHHEADEVKISLDVFRKV
jgi:hypothetical protein